MKKKEIIRYWYEEHPIFTTEDRQKASNKLNMSVTNFTKLGREFNYKKVKVKATKKESPYWVYSREELL